MHRLIVALLAFVLVSAAHAQVHVDIGVSLPAPPQLAVIPEVQAVQYAPAAPTNIFFYDAQYWAYVNGGWHVSYGYNGPWIVVAPQVVPRPLLLVPVNYYRAPPGDWKKWHRNEPPRWGDKWGREWSEEHEAKPRKHEGKTEQATREHEHEKEHGHGDDHGHGGK